MEDGAVPLGCGVALEDGLEEDLLDALNMLPLVGELERRTRRPGGPPVNGAQEGCVPVPLRQGADGGNGPCSVTEDDFCGAAQGAQEGSPGKGAAPGAQEGGL